MGARRWWNDETVIDDETVEDRLLTNRHLELIDDGADDAGCFWVRRPVPTVTDHGGDGGSLPHHTRRN
jgi:hypothetical protein